MLVLLADYREHRGRAFPTSVGALVFFSLGSKMIGKVRPSRSSTGSDHSSFFASGVLIWLVLGTDGWVYYLGYILFFIGILGLGQRVLRATTEIAPTGLKLKGHYGRRTQVTWTDVADVLPARFSSGRSRVRLVDGRRVLLGGVPAVRARRLRELMNRSAPGLRTE